MVTFTIVDYWQYNYKISAPNRLMDTEEKYLNGIGNTHQYHDKIFKKILDDKTEFAQFINNHLEFEETQEKIKAEEIEKYNREFITEGFEVKKADIIYKIKNRNVFIIVEHQSSIDYNMAERMTRYCLEIIKSVYKKETANQIYPLICPIVLYTGSRKWDAPTTLGELQEEYYGFPPLEYPKYNLIDVNEYTYQELLEEQSAIAKAMLFEKLKGDVGMTKFERFFIEVLEDKKEKIKEEIKEELKAV